MPVSNRMYPLAFQNYGTYSLGMEKTYWILVKLKDNSLIRIKMRNKRAREPIRGRKANGPHSTKNIILRQCIAVFKQTD